MSTSCGEEEAESKQQLVVLRGKEKEEGLDYLWDMESITLGHCYALSLYLWTCFFLREGNKI